MSILLQVLGAIGACAIILCYFLSQQSRFSVNSVRYLLGNAFGATCILLSLIGAWNLPSAIIESFWVLISLYGLSRPYKLDAQTRLESPLVKPAATGESD
jgi:hypothetical protein